MRAWIVFSVLLVTGMFAAPVLAQTSTASIATETTLLPSLTAPQVGEYKLKAGLNSTNDSGRFAEYSDSTGRTYRLQNEYYVGVGHVSGWALTGMAVTNGKAFGDPNKDAAFGAGDPSLSLEHPVMDDGTTRIWGRLRRYFAVTDNSKASDLAQYAYYLFSTRQLAGRAELFNVVIFRDFVRSSNKPSDTVYVLEDTTKFTQKFNSWFKAGFAQHAQVEWHDQTPTGQYFEVYPYVDFVINKNAFIEPRLVMPVHKVNELYDSAKTVGLNGSQAEVFLQVSI